MSAIFDQMLSHYEIKTTEDKRNALHEVMQQVTLSALYRAGFFDKAAFYGGTCLRIFHKLPRFSEDMGFSLLKRDDNFTLNDYFDLITAEFFALGRNVTISRKVKTKNTQIESAFLKDNPEIYNIALQTERSVKIKVEVDTNPPSDFETEQKLLMLPFSFMTRCFTIPDLFAGKMHAFLFRSWGNRVKGRDWFDLEWYVRNNHPLGFDHLKERCIQSGHVNTDFSHQEFKQLLQKRIRDTNIERVKDDVRPFIQDTESLKIWSTEYFSQIANSIQLQ